MLCSWAQCPLLWLCMYHAHRGPYQSSLKRSAYVGNEVESCLQAERSHERTTALPLCGQRGGLGLRSRWAPSPPGLAQEEAASQALLLVEKWCCGLRAERRETTLAVRVPGKPREGAECEDGPRNLGTLSSQEIWTRGDRRGVVKRNKTGGDEMGLWCAPRERN